MTTPQPSQRPSRFAGRTRLATIVSIAVVGLAGATAVSASMGMFDTTPANNAGAAAVAAPPAPAAQVVDVYLPSDTAVATTAAPTTAPAVADATIQAFTVDTAGVVAVASTPTGLRLESVTPTTGWTWTLSQTNQTELQVTMTDGHRTLEFVAATTADGNIAASVHEPIVTPAPAAASTGGTSGGGEQEHEGGGDDD